MSKALIVGSGPSGSIVAMVLARAGWDVVMFEKGVNHYTNLERSTPGTNYGNDELKMHRGFGRVDFELEPRTFRFVESQAEPEVTGEVNHLPSGVGGGTTLWDAKVPRFWDLDFKKATMLGPIDGADVRDWPVSYDDMVPWYDLVEDLMGVAGDLDAMAGSPSLKHAPRTRGFTMPPNPPMRSGVVLADGARKMGLHPFPFMELINSEFFDDRPACIGCGFCAGYGCPIHDRGSALIPIRHALATGRLDLRSEALVSRIEHDGKRASGVRWIDRDGKEQTETGDLVVLSAGAVDTSRFALISELPDPNDLIGRGIMFHWFTAGYGVFLDQRIHAHKGRDSSQAHDDYCDPEFPGARAAAKAAGLPYLRGGIVEIGGSTHVIDEALQYLDLMDIFNADKPFGTVFKQYMRVSPLRDRLAGLQMISEDLMQRSNRVDLDPSVKDRYGLPVPRVTYNPHVHELAAQDFYLPKLIEMIQASGASRSGAIAQSGSVDRPSLTGDPQPGGLHCMGGMVMGDDAASSVCDAHGMVRGLANVAVSDGGVFPTSGAHNPTLTIMAMALRNAWTWSGRTGVPTLAEVRGYPAGGSSADAGGGSTSGVTTPPAGATGSSGLPVGAVIGGGVVAVAAAAGLAVAARSRSGPAPASGDDEATPAP